MTIVYIESNLYGQGGQCMSESNYVLYFKALADETRLNILKMLRTENLCACHILDEFKFTQPTLSYHMKILVESKLVSSCKDGNWTRYSLNQESFKHIKDLFDGLDTLTILDRKVGDC